MQYLPDTNVFIAVMNGSSPAVDQQLVRHRRDILLSSVVLHELYFGAFASKKPEHNLRRIAALRLPVMARDVTALEAPVQDGAVR